MTSHKIKDNCPECNPRSYEISILSFIGKHDEITDDYLYQCDECDAKILISAYEIEKALHN